MQCAPCERVSGLPADPEAAYTRNLVDQCFAIYATFDALSCGAIVERWLQGTDSLKLFSLKGVEIMVFAHILVLLCDRYTSGSEQLPVLLGP